MEEQTPSRFEISEPLVNSNIFTPVETSIDENKNQIDKVSIKICFPCFFLFQLNSFFKDIFMLFFSPMPISLFNFLVDIFFICLNLNFQKFKLEVYKLNNIIYVTIKNCLTCIKSHYNSFNGNLHFYYDVQNNGDPEFANSYFFIINDLNFDLDSNNIKAKPAFLFSFIENEINMQNANKIINKFEVNKYENNPLLFDIAKYMGKKKDPLENAPEQIISRLMKFGEHFFTFYLDSPLLQRGIYYYYPIIILCLHVFNVAFTFALSVIIISEENIYITIIAIFGFIVINVFIYLIIIAIYKCRSKDSRIDFIYSKNYDKLFIGIVNSEQNRYSKSFEYQIDEIDKFFFQIPELNKGNIIFKAILKNKKIDTIAQIKSIDKYEQEGLEYILNEKKNN